MGTARTTADKLENRGYIQGLMSQMQGGTTKISCSVKCVGRNQEPAKNPMGKINLIFYFRTFIIKLWVGHTVIIRRLHSLVNSGLCSTRMIMINMGRILESRELYSFSRSSKHNRPCWFSGILPDRIK